MIQRIFTTTILILAFGLALPACQNRFTASQAGVDANKVPPKQYDVRTENEVLRVRPGTSGQYHIRIINQGTKHDTYTITAPTTRSALGWIALARSVPFTITVEPEQYFDVPITFSVPMTATAGMRDELEITVDNHAIVRFSEPGIIQVKVDPDAPTAGG